MVWKAEKCCIGNCWSPTKPCPNLCPEENTMLPLCSGKTWNAASKGYKPMSDWHKTEKQQKGKTREECEQCSCCSQDSQSRLGLYTTQQVLLYHDQMNENSPGITPWSFANDRWDFIIILKFESFQTVTNPNVSDYNRILIHFLSSWHYLELFLSSLPT